MPTTYVGFHQDNRGITQLGRTQILMDEVQAEWDEYAGLPSRPPPELQQRHTHL